MPLALPSSDSAQDLIDGKPGAASRVLVHMLGRAALIGTGMALAGMPRKDLPKYAIAASVAIEAFALGWFAFQKNAQRANSLGQMIYDQPDVEPISIDDLLPSDRRFDAAHQWRDRLGRKQRAPAGFMWSGETLVRNPVDPAPVNGKCPSGRVLFKYANGAKTCLKPCGVIRGAVGVWGERLRNKRTGRCAADWTSRIGS